ncbi:methyltransferase (TIGR00027 family) [Streptomyces sp. Amel2xB2]|uniref:SAM-dependent methyltransferase n=1 Tax=Streptomyces sp. Amel2xB2 TaxID=1305829 RepID=UPI000DBA7F0A|nr:SAM-dependent methyltransferase [Streptomyces sp. Amel2xB2]RAJ71338.1 methyltransferase (TIGR00027 family) [Streptomyces sp. Amel2xB2]
MSTDQQWDIVTGVGLTALAVAAGRAAESARPDALITDPYAARLVAAAQAPVPFPFADGAEGAAGMASEDEELWRGATDYIGLRSRVFDDYFLSASEEGIRQAVILASGLDTRPYRLSWPSGTVCFELDQPAVLAFKSETLEGEGATPGCDRRPVPIDLREDWGAALEAAGFDPSRPTAWLAEGLLPYLPPEAEVRLFTEVSRLSAAGSRFAVERIDNVMQVLDDETMVERSKSLGMDFRSLFPEGDRSPVADQLKGLGWELEEHGVAESAAALDRPVPGITIFAEHVSHTFGRLG